MGMEGLDLVRFWFLWCFWHCSPKPDTMRRIIVKFLKPQPHLPGNATIRQGSTPGWKKLYVYAATQYDFGPKYQQQRINIKTPNGISHSPAKRFRALQFAMHRDGGLIGLLCEVISKKLNSRQICWGDAKHYDYIMARLICIETWAHNHLRWISHYVQPTKIVGLGYLQKKGSNCCKISALEGVFYLHGAVGVPCQIATEINTGCLLK